MKTKNLPTKGKGASILTWQSNQEVTIEKPVGYVIIINVTK